MTTETDRARPRGLGRIDPALRDAAAGLDVNEFQAESLPAERARADRIAAERAAAVDAEFRAESLPARTGTYRSDGCRPCSGRRHR